MKKIRFIAVAVILSMLFCLTACGDSDNTDLNKKVLTPDDFESLMFEQGYNIYDITAQVVDYDEIQTVYVATTGDELYQIEYIELVDEKSAYALFVGNQVMFEECKDGDDFTEYDLELANFNEYHLTSSGRFMMLLRVENTLIYVDAEDQFQTEIEAALDAIGY